MEIGKPERRIKIVPATNPVPQPEPAPVPEQQPEKVGT